jgi:hypothetical protein
MIAQRTIFTLLLVFVIVSLQGSAEQLQYPSRSDSKHGSLEGSLAMRTREGPVLLPESAKVYLVYYKDSSNAGSVFRAAQLKAVKVLERETTRRKESIRQEPLAQRNDEFERYHIQVVETALAKTSDWVVRHKKPEQLIAATPDPEGNWIQSGLAPGRYIVIASGKFGDHDAQWEGEADVNPGTKTRVSFDNVWLARSIPQ